MAGAEDGFDTAKLSTTGLYARLYKHIADKGWQAGSLVGCAVVLPVLAGLHYKRGGSRADFAPKAARALGLSGGCGLAAVGVLGTARVLTAITERDAVADRVYRLHYNQGQTRTDLFADVGLAAGVGLALALFGTSATFVVGGAAAGTAAGVVAHALTSEELRKSKPQQWNVEV